MIDDVGFENTHFCILLYFGCIKEYKFYFFLFADMKDPFDGLICTMYTQKNLCELTT